MENITVNFENLSEQEREQLLGLVKKANETPKKRWRAKEDCKYYYVDKEGDVGCYEDDFHNTDNKLYSIGNYFRTEELAKFESEKRKIYQELKDFALEHNEREINWKDLSQGKHYFYYNHHINKIKPSRLSYMQDIYQVYFTSEEIVIQAIQAIGEDRIKKYLFGITD